MDGNPSGIERTRQFVAMDLLMPGDDRVHDRDSNTAANIAEQIVKSAGVADFFILQERHRGGRKRDKHAARAEPADQDGPQECPLTDAEVDLAEPQAGRAEHREAEGDEPAVVHFRREIADDGHGDISRRCRAG